MYASQAYFLNLKHQGNLTKASKLTTHKGYKKNDYYRLIWGNANEFNKTISLPSIINALSLVFAVLFLRLIT